MSNLVIVESPSKIKTVKKYLGKDYEVVASAGHIRDLPKSKLGQAFTYAFNQKEGLMNYLLDGNCSISNNLAENSIRSFTIGRKNWLFSGSPKGAQASAGIYTLIETAKANNLKPYEYFEYLLEEIPKHMDDTDRNFLNKLLPWSSELPEHIQKTK